MARLCFLAVLAFLVFGFSSCSCGEEKKNDSGNAVPAEVEVGKVVARIIEYKLEGEPGPNQDAVYKLSIEFPTTQAIGDIIFRNSKSKFGGSRLEVRPPSCEITVMVKPSAPVNAGVICVVALDKDGRGFGGQFVTDEPVSTFSYELPKAGAEFTPKLGEEVIIAAARRKVDGVQKEFFELVLKTWSVEDLLKEYGNSDNLGREGLLEKVAKIGDPAAVPRLFKLTEEEPDPHLRTLILHAAGTIAKVDVTGPAIEYYAIETEIEPRGKVMHMLGRYRSKRGFDKLLKTIHSNTDTRVRVDAALALGKYDPEQSYDELFKVLKDDSMPFIVRQNAAGSLAAHHDADIKKLLADVEKYRMEVEPDSIMDKTLLNFEDYLNKVLRGEVDRHHHEEEMDD